MKKEYEAPAVEYISFRPDEDLMDQTGTFTPSMDEGIEDDDQYA